MTNKPQDPNARVKEAQETALRIAGLFREIGYEIVVVGGSAIEMYTAGDYMSEDVDICFVDRQRPPLRTIAEVMAKAGGTPSTVKSFKVKNLFIDVLGELETTAGTKLRTITGPGGGSFKLAKPEDLLAERVLVSVYPERQEDARNVAKKLLAVCLSGQVEIDWDEAVRVAASNEYRIKNEFVLLLKETKEELEKKGPVANTPGQQWFAANLPVLPKKKEGADDLPPL